MPERLATKHELRCPFCRYQPLLAYYGIDERGRLYIHQKVFKGGRVYGESLFYGGTVVLRCRECNRWHQVVIQEQSSARLRPTQMPRALREEADARRSLPTDQSSS